MMKIARFSARFIARKCGIHLQPYLYPDIYMTLFLLESYATQKDSRITPRVPPHSHALRGLLHFRSCGFVNAETLVGRYQTGCQILRSISRG